MSTRNEQVVASNRKARHDYDIVDTIECGIALQGSEVKSLRAAKMQLKDSYAYIKNGEVWLHGAHIAPYSFSHGLDGHDPERERKLLLHRSEIEQLRQRVDREQLTLVPLSVYFKNSRAKVDLGVARGRKRLDKRQALAERDANRDIARAMADERRGR